MVAQRRQLFARDVWANEVEFVIDAVETPMADENEDEVIFRLGFARDGSHGFVQARLRGLVAGFLCRRAHRNRGFQ